MACTGPVADAVRAETPGQRAIRDADESADSKSKRIEFENAQVKIVVIPRTREQMTAFYEGRGFPQAAINAVAQACFMTVGIHNKTADVLWLELDNWRFDSAEADPKRLDKDYWNRRWESLAVPMPSRSTFGWTLLPEQRDLRAGEGVGGNITLLYTDHPLTLTALFARGENKQEKPLGVQLKNLQCLN